MKVLSTNKKARHKFEILETFDAGIKLEGSEIKSLRQGGNVSFNDSYCTFINNEMFVKGLYIKEFDLGNHKNHEPTRDRKLLLTKKELNKLHKKYSEKGLSVVPISIFISDNGWAKLKIALARGKKEYEKRDKIKKKDFERETNNY